jgi:hypothetical protein
MINDTCEPSKVPSSVRTDKKPTDVTATIMTVVPSTPVQRPRSVNQKERTVTIVTDMIAPKPIRHLAILPSSNDSSNKTFTTDPLGLSGMIHANMFTLLCY